MCPEQGTLCCRAACHQAEQSISGSCYHGCMGVIQCLPQQQHGTFIADGMLPDMLPGDLH